MDYPQKIWSGNGRAADRGPREYVPRLVSDNERPTPASQESEEHLLAACMVEGSDVMSRCLAAKLSPDSFHFPRNQQLYALFVGLHTAGKPVSLETVAQELRDRAMFETVGGFEWLLGITSAVPTTAHASYMLGKVKEKWVLRKLIADATDAVDQCYSFTGNPEEILAPLAQRFNRAVEYVRAGEDTLAQKVAAARTRTLNKIEGKQDLSRQLITSLPEFNQRFGAFDMLEEDFLVGIAGATSIGKSAFTRAIVDDFLFLPQPSGQPKAGMVFLLETTIAKYLELMAARKVRWNSRELSRMPADVRARYLAAYSAREALVGQRLHLFEDMVTVEVLVARVEDHLREHGERSLDFVVGDHLHELYSSRQELRRNREAELGYIVKFLKQSAKRLGVPFFLPTQLNRSPAKDGTVRRPTKNDLRGSGELENAFDRLLLLHLPTVDVRGAEQTDNQARVMIEIIQAKSRNGPIGHREFWFDRPFGDYVDIRDHELGKRTNTPGGTKGPGGYGRQG